MRREQAAQRGESGLLEATREVAGVLLSGTPQPLARALFEALWPARAGATFYLLVERSATFIARDLCRALEARHPALVGRWRVVPADLREPDLALSETIRAELGAVVGEVWHLAALDVGVVSHTRAHRLRVEGTRHLLDLCRAWPQLRRFHHVSSCDVAGKRTGRIYEDELDRGQDFFDQHEATRFAAEREVQRRRDELPITIYRPARLVGTGTAHDAAHALFRSLSARPPGLPLLLPPPSKETIDLVPMDFAAAAMVRLADHPAALGRVFQLADPTPPTAAMLTTATAQLLRRTPLLRHLPRALVPAFFDADLLQRAADLVPRPRRFDVSNTADALGEGFACPPFDVYWPQLLQQRGSARA